VPALKRGDANFKMSSDYASKLSKYGNKGICGVAEVIKMRLIGVVKLDDL